MAKKIIKFVLDECLLSFLSLLLELMLLSWERKVAWEWLWKKSNNIPFLISDSQYKSGNSGNYCSTILLKSWDFGLTSIPVNLQNCALIKYLFNFKYEKFHKQKIFSRPGVSVDFCRFSSSAQNPSYI